PDAFEVTQLELGALLHDASEAYIKDIPRPLKPFFPGYVELEATVMAAVADAARLPRGFYRDPYVCRADDMVLATEKRDLMAPEPESWGLVEKPLAEPKPLIVLTPEKAEYWFAA